MFDIVGQILIGWLLADLLTGIVHWWMDRFGKVEWPIIGPLFIQANVEHHATPLDFLGASLLKRNRGLWAATGLISGLWLLALGPSVLWFTTTVVAAFSGEIHVISHRPGNAGLLLRTLRAAGLVQSPAQHARHHRTPNDSCFCVVTNWLNPVLDELRIWSRLESVFRRKPGPTWVKE